MAFKSFSDGHLRHWDGLGGVTGLKPSPGTKRPQCVHAKQVLPCWWLCGFGLACAHGVVIPHFNEEKMKDAKKKRKEGGTIQLF